MTNPHDNPEVSAFFGQRPDLNRGVQALFNGDLHAGNPGYAPREDWVVLSPEEIVYSPLSKEVESKDIDWNPLLGAFTRNLHNAPAVEVGANHGQKILRSRTWMSGDSRAVLTEETGAELDPEYELQVTTPTAIWDYNRDTGVYSQRQKVEYWYIVPDRSVSYGAGLLSEELVDQDVETQLVNGYQLDRLAIHLDVKGPKVGFIINVDEHGWVEKIERDNQVDPFVPMKLPLLRILQGGEDA